LKTKYETIIILLLFFVEFTYTVGYILQSKILSKMILQEQTENEILNEIRNSSLFIFPLRPNTLTVFLICI